MKLYSSYEKYYLLGKITLIKYKNKRYKTFFVNKMIIYNKILIIILF